MIAGWVVATVALAYLILLFGISQWGRTANRSLLKGQGRATIYALSLGIYCTAWVFFGSVSLASWEGLDFLAIYLGPILAISLGNPLIRRIVHIAKTQNVTSIADFVAARYGKSVPIAALVSGIAFIGAIPYISFQIRMIAASVETMTMAGTSRILPPDSPAFNETSLVVAIVLVVFTILLGTRRIDETENQDGLLLAVSFDSVVKLAAFLVVGFYVTYKLFDGFDAVIMTAQNLGFDPTLIARTVDLSTYATMVVLSGFAMLLLPRQFHIAVVENRNVDDLRRASWLFPLYLVLLSIFIVPITLVGLLTYGYPPSSGSMAALALPLHGGSKLVGFIVLIGSLSAATMMVVVESVALAIMVSNHVIMPLALRERILPTGDIGTANKDLSGFVRTSRRCAVVFVIALAYFYQIGPISIPIAQAIFLTFGAFIQIAPALMGGLFWSRGTALGAAVGMIAGLAIWAYTLLLPNMISDTSPWFGIIADGPFGMWLLRPTALFDLGLSPLNNAVFWSVGINMLAYIGFSLLKAPQPLEKLQANAFIGAREMSSSLSFRFFRSSVTVEELRTTVARYLGDERTNRSFKSFAHSRNIILNDREEADLYLLRFAEHLLASAIGAASSRLALSLVLRRRTVSTKAALKLLDDASAAIQYSRDLLQHAVDHARQGITVFDKDLTVLTWNHAFVELYDLPHGMVHVGIGLDEIIRFNAMRGTYGPGSVEELVTQRLHSFVYDTEPVRLKLLPRNKVLEIRTNQLPEGGYVTTYTDVTDLVAQEEERRKANETLELRVRERTEELTRLNAELTRAKSEADDANLSKTRFLAAAGHDILQPLNAARLYSTSLQERSKGSENALLAENVNASLDAVEEILTALLDISRLDTGAMKAQLSSFRIEEILIQLQREFEPVAKEKGLQLHFIISSMTIHSDRRLLRRLLQNLISNAIKYTPSGRVLVGVKRRNGNLSLEVWDTGLGIPESQQKIVFHEFKRLDQGAKVARGLGLGLSIVERIARVLKHKVDLFSKPGRGSVFRVEVPIAAALPAVKPASAEPHVPATPLVGMRVLAIDNEPVILEGMQVLLRGWGCEIMTASGIEAARNLLEDDPAAIDAVIADYHLDDGDGLQAIEVVRWMTQDEILAVLVTADRSAAVREMAASANVHLHNKPLKPAGLRALLGQWRLMQAPVE